MSSSHINCQRRCTNKLCPFQDKQRVYLSSVMSKLGRAQRFDMVPDIGGSTRPTTLETSDRVSNIHSDCELLKSVHIDDCKRLRTVSDKNANGCRRGVCETNGPEKWKRLFEF